MLGDAPITLVGNLTGDPESRQAGSATVTSFTVAMTPRVKQDDGSYGDGEATFYRCSAWRELGSNVAASLHKGDRVIVQGTIASRSYEKDGKREVSWEVQVEAIGPELRFATAQVTRGGAGGGRGRQQQPRQQQQPVAQQQWSTPGAYDSDVPF